jgi:archaeosine-15-forming tRNA-guanine transglycosylase
MLVLAVNRVEREGSVRRFVPAADEQLRRGDRLIVMAPQDRLAAFGVDQPTKA